MSTILVTGGAGYIGSFMVRRLLEEDYSVIVFDNLSRGNTQIPSNVKFINGDIGNKEAIDSLFQENEIDGVIHFAGYISMGESMENPFIYFENNTFSTLNLLEALKKYNVKNIIFSSTAGVYGNPVQVPIPEDHPKSPTNPYGESKLMVENLLRWYQQIYGINFVALRYFNACGASIDGMYGENHSPETHLIPCAINALVENREFSLFGTDYDTPDGTCVRDYIHVLDLVDAHVLALRKTMDEPGGYTYNVGTGKGFSNREVLNVIEEVSGRKINVIEKERRPGDANELVADVSGINNKLGFSPKYSDMKTIIESAWKWHTRDERRDDK